MAEIAELTAHRTALADQARDQRIVVDDLEVERRKVDADVEQARTRRDRDRSRMDAGQIADPKALERMSQELVSLDRRIASLEDDELEIMEALERAQEVLDSLAGQVSAADERLAALAVARDEVYAEVDARLGDLERQRAPFAEALPAELLALYEKLRAAKGGIGAAKLHQRRCTGCQITLDHAELARIKATPVDTVLRCEECSRILVRTPESGL